jgi:hypothetical protein
MPFIERQLNSDPVAKVSGLEGRNGPAGEQWIHGKYATVPVLRKQAKQAGVAISSKAGKREIVQALKTAGIEPRRPGVTL